MVLSSRIIMMASAWRTYMRRALFLIFLICLMLFKPGAAARQNPDDTVGQYQMIFRGCYSGTGKGMVNPNSVHLNGNLVDEGGNRVNFVAPNLKLENHRFHDTVTVAGKTINISGRVDSSGGALRKARIICTFEAVGVGFGRAAGEHN